MYSEEFIFATPSSHGEFEFKTILNYRNGTSHAMIVEKDNVSRCTFCYFGINITIHDTFLYLKNWRKTDTRSLR